MNKKPSELEKIALKVTMGKAFDDVIPENEKY